MQQMLYKPFCIYNVGAMATARTRVATATSAVWLRVRAWFGLY